MVNSYMMVDGGGSSAVPSLAALPDVDTDAAALMESAELLRNAGSRLRTGSEAAGTTWDSLSAVYTASGTEPLYSQFQPIVTRGDAMATALTNAGDALSDFALAVGGLKFEHDDLASRITSLQSQYYETEPDSVDRMLLTGQVSQLEMDISSFAGRVELAEETCIDALAAISGGTATGVTRTASAASSSTSYVTALDAAVSASVLDQLEQLAQMTPDEAAAWLAANPEFAEALATSPPPVADVAAWWGSLGDGVPTSDGTFDPNGLQLAIISAMPLVIGNLDGVPYWARSDANEIALDEELVAAAAGYAEAEGTGTYDEYGRYWPSHAEQVAEATLLQLQGIREAMDRDGLHQLIELHPGEPTLAAISTGDLDTATSIGVLVPGIRTSAEDMPGLVNATDAIVAEQGGPDGGGTHGPAVIAWMGYETPGLDTVWGTDHAQAGAEDLGSTLDGLTATLGGDPRLTVYGYSYGSTTAGVALAEDGHGVDALVTMGSAGLTVDEAADLDVPEVWAGQAPNDVIADIGRWSWFHPNDPLGDDFGSQYFEVDYALDDPHGLASYTSGSSLENIAAIGLGDVDEVTTGDGRLAPEPGPSPTPPGP